MENYYGRLTFRPRSESKYWARKKCHKGCNIGLRDGQGRPNTASCWGAAGAARGAAPLPPSIPATQMETEAAHAPDRDVKMGTLSPNTRRRMHPRVPQTLTAPSSNVGSKRHSLPFAPTDVFSVKLQTNICHIVCLINFNSMYAFTATWQMLSLQ